jgi:hypothetical protein
LAFDVLQGIRVAEVISYENTANLNVNNNSSNSQLSLLSSAKQPLINFEADEPQTIREENIRQLVADCRRELIDGIEDCYGSWALINCAEYDRHYFLLFFWKIINFLYFLKL